MLFSPWGMGMAPHGSWLPARHPATQSSKLACEQSSSHLFPTFQGALSFIPSCPMSCKLLFIFCSVMASSEKVNLVCYSISPRSEKEENGDFLVHNCAAYENNIGEIATKLLRSRG